jgi:small GTP-binding protein
MYQKAYSTAMAIILVYDVTNEKSFRDVESWITTINQNAKDNIVLVIIGNKCDIANRAVSTEEGKKIASKYNALFYETSAKENIGIDDAFNHIVSKLMKNVEPSVSTQTVPIVDTQQSPRKKSFCILL